MLRLIWGESAMEKLQQEKLSLQQDEILRLRAQVADLQHSLLAQAESSRLAQQEAYKSFLSFLRPPVEPSQHTPVAARQWPGERPDTAPSYPEKPPWAKQEVKTAGDS